MIKQNLTPEEFSAMRRKDGISASIDQAASILKFFEMFADIVVDSYLRSSEFEDNGFVEVEHLE